MSPPSQRVRRPRITYLEVNDPEDLRLTGFFCRKPCPQSAAVAAFRRRHPRSTEIMDDHEPPGLINGDDQKSQRIFVVELEKHRRLYPYQVCLRETRQNEFTDQRDIFRKPDCKTCDRGWINLSEPQLHHLRSQLAYQVGLTPRPELRDLLSSSADPLKNRRKRVPRKQNSWHTPPSLSSGTQILDIRIALVPSSSSIKEE